MNDYNLAPRATRGLGRTYMYFTGKPTCPFGYGLSYTTFHYRGARVSGTLFGVTGTLRASFRVTNTGQRAGATVTQLYATPPRVPGAGLPREILVGFRRIRVLQPGASQHITISVPLISTLRRWSAARGREVVYPGTWQFLLARSSSDIVRRFPVRITGQIPRSIATVTLAPPLLTLAPGQTLNLRGTNPWLAGLAPSRYQREGDPIISAVRRDDTFANLAHVP